jgi:hypothetical protein
MQTDLQTDLQTQVVLCPNCKEEVPKTLYCLNCGYPLYKMELDLPIPETQDVSVEVEPEPFSLQPLMDHIKKEEVAVNMEDLATPEEEEKEEVDVEAKTTIEPLEPIEAVEPTTPEAVGEVVEAEQELGTLETIEEYVEPEKELEQPVVEIVELEAEIITEQQEESADEEEPTEIPEETEETVEEIVVEEPVAEPMPSFEPEPVVREVMENLAKNISTKIKLVNLLQEGGVKTETFNRLFESYVARGELLMNSRNEMLERVRFDLESMEKALDEAKIGLEELKIRRAIGDASESEYNAKSPGFEWDIKQYEDEVAKKKSEMVYLEDLTQVMSAEEINELKEKGESGCEAVDGFADIGKISSETATKAKVALEEALAYLKVSC